MNRKHIWRALELACNVAQEDESMGVRMLGCAAGLADQPSRDGTGLWESETSRAINDFVRAVEKLRLEEKRRSALFAADAARKAREGES